MAEWNDIPDYEPYERDEFHATFSVQLGELIHDGWIDFSDESWNFDSFDEEQRNRFWKKFQDRFFYREIGIVPPGRWKHETLRKLNEIMPKYKPAYAALANGQDIFQKYGSYGKSRNVFSDFPQTLLGGNQDYASNATDREHEEIYLGDWFEKMERIKGYDDVDLLILKEMETMFSCMYSVSINGY